jgi:hypothetical protein
MDGENIIANIDQTDWAALKGRLIEAGCHVLMMRAVGGEIAHWNGALDPRPKMLVRCSTVAQVSSVMRAASAFDAPLGVYNGGQDWNGRSMRDGSLLLDLCDLQTIEIDTGRREATIGAGVTTAQLNRAAGERGLVAVIGNDGAVSMAGLTLGGGYGPLMTRFGLACDNLLSAEVVLLDGSIVTCDGEREPDLFYYGQCAQSRPARRHPPRPCRCLRRPNLASMITLSARTSSTGADPPGAQLL